MSRRIVICAPGGERGQWDLPASDFIERPWIWGGVRTLHELAFAVAATGSEVELRGWLDQRLFEELASASGVSPNIGRDTRRPEVGEIVILPEGHADPMQFARVWLSGAQLVLLALGPLGLVGWPFAAGWDCRSPMTVRIDEVNRAEDFASIAAMAIAVWSNSRVIAEAARQAGVHATLIGAGQPMPLPDPPPEKTVEIAWVADNRWAPFAEPVAQQLDELSVDRIETVDHGEMLRRLARARMLLYPTGIEGEPRITHEARAVGTVPVVLTRNPLATQISEPDGVVAVDEPESMAATVRALLADPDRLAALSERARASAREEAAWDPFVERVRMALATLPNADAAIGARQAIGERLALLLGEMTAARATAEERTIELEQEIERVRADRDRIHVQEHQVRAELAELYANRAVRIALRLRELGSRGSS